MRLPVVIAVCAAAASILLCAGSASAQFFENQSLLFGRLTGPQAPWCSHEDIGGGAVVEDCSFRSFEQCRRIAVGVDNAFCTPNPSYDLTVRPLRHHKGHRLPHRHRRR